jgi:hypothetical protein
MAIRSEDNSLKILQDTKSILKRICAYLQVNMMLPVLDGPGPGKSVGRVLSDMKNRLIRSIHNEMVGLDRDRPSWTELDRAGPKP